MSLDAYAGIFSNISGGYDQFATTSWDDFFQKWSESKSGPLCLSGLDTYQENHTTTWYTGVWTQQTSPSSDPCLWTTSNWTLFLEHHADCSDNARLLDFDIHPGSDWARTYTGTWGDSPIEQVLVSDLSLLDFAQELKTLFDQGLRLTKAKIHPTSVLGEYHITGLFEKAANPSESFGLVVTNAWDWFYDIYLNMTDLQLVDYQVYDDDIGHRWYLGIWRESPTLIAQQFIFDQDPSDFWFQENNLSQHGWRLQSAVRYCQSVRVPRPDWNGYLSQVFAPMVQGYAYMVMQNGIPVANGSYGNARDANDTQSAFDLNSRMHIASVSKTVAAMTILNLSEEKGISIDAPFWDPYMKTQIPNVGPGVENVTIRQLLNMTSGMDMSWDALWFGANYYWSNLSHYLARQNVTENGKIEQYSNTNYLIIQALIDCLLGNNGSAPTQYPEYAFKTILEPMGINSTLWSIYDNLYPNATLSYSTPPSPKEPGYYFWEIQNVAGAGWVTNAVELAKFLQGIRNNVVLNASATAEMLGGNLGFDHYKNDGLYGKYHHKNGIFYENDSLYRNGSLRGLRTVIASLPFGYDVLLITNTYLPYLDTVDVVFNAFESRVSSSSAAASSSGATGPTTQTSSSYPASFSIFIRPSKSETSYLSTQGHIWALVDFDVKSYLHSLYSRLLSYVIE